MQTRQRTRSRNMFFRVALVAMSIGAAADPLKEGFVTDAAFNSGYLVDDRFATSGVYTDFYASKAARLSDGDVVVVGLVPAAYQGDQANGLFNIGLVRYGSNGERPAWPAATAMYASYFDRYLQYPNSYGKFGRIDEVVVVNGFIYVLADYIYSETDHYVQIVVFNDWGGFVGAYSASSGLYESGIGMVTLTIGGVRKLVTVNTTYRLIGSFPQRYEYYLRMYRFDLAADGSVSNDNTFGSAGGTSIVDPDCTVTEGDCYLQATAISLVGSGTFVLGPYVVYAIGDYACNPNLGIFCTEGDNPLQILKLSPSSGALLSRSTTVLHDPAAASGALESHARDIVASRSALVGGGFSDSTYALASVKAQCSDGLYYRRGAAVIRIDGNGNADTGFAGNGTLLFGGQPVGPTCPPGEAPTAEPKAITLGAYDRIGVVGSTSDKAANPTHSDGFLAVIRADLGGIADYAVHPALHYNDAPWGNYAGFNDVISYDNGTFTAAGSVTTEYNAYQFGTTRFKTDRVFADDYGR